ncbi:hypothetical protein AJ78_00820 [Emergomyces pasteurianus Ep9510]|uniref:Uncharacterized protein n=1 Tax=Emergomyces pasteurianus Ep9510 TaxID=1447872 RepID=A0A1J9QSM9_9EURO|nr:hypothetical protein AJ78_00820 [Emergomyces pasteurianus Ep9510]
MKLKYVLLLADTIATITNEPKRVFAHFMVGDAAAMTRDQWETDIKLAKDAHIDGFALNIAPQDSYTNYVLLRAYEAATAVGDFTLFLSFDYLSGGPWPADRVIRLINAFKGNPAQFKYENKPVVSTFEGVNNVNDWYGIKNATGCFFIPSWTSLGPNGLQGVMGVIDGAFSWDAWPEGAHSKSIDSDVAYMSVLGNKPYMMPVSPWFYANLPQWNKNWLWRGDDLWYERWQQVIKLQPQFVEIISWNDYGESHYIGPIYPPGIPSGAERYVVGCPHDAWRVLLPAYIDAYKSNRGIRIGKDASQTTHGSNHLPVGVISGVQNLIDVITYWYRLNHSTPGDTGGTTGNNPQQGQAALSPGLVSQDKIFTSIFVTEPSEILVQIGDNPPTRLLAYFAGINHYSVPFENYTGPVKITVLRNGAVVVSTTGPPITQLSPGSLINWNAYVGSSL